MQLRKFCQKGVTSYTFFSQCRLSSVFDGTLKKFQQKCVPSYTFFRCGDYLKFLRGLGKFRQKSVPSHRFLRCGDYLKFLIGLGKFRQKSVISYTVFRSADYLKFLMGLRKIPTKMCAQSHVFSLWRLTWVFDGTWKNFHKKSVPSHSFLRCADYLKFLMGLGKNFTKKCAQSHVSSLWRLTWVFDAT